MEAPIITPLLFFEPFTIFLLILLFIVAAPGLGLIILGAIIAEFWEDYIAPFLLFIALPIVTLVLSGVFLGLQITGIAVVSLIAIAAFVFLIKKIMMLIATREERNIKRSQNKAQKLIDSGNFEKGFKLYEEINDEQSIEQNLSQVFNLIQVYVGATHSYSKQAYKEVFELKRACCITGIPSSIVYKAQVIVADSFAFLRGITHALSDIGKISPSTIQTNQQAINSKLQRLTAISKEGRERLADYRLSAALNPFLLAEVEQHLQKLIDEVQSWQEANEDLRNYMSNVRLSG